VLVDKEAVIFFDSAAQHLERDDEQDDANARASEDSI
jgi:hypothetical protein